ncbi:hypothetical protein Poly21_07020 [Allorhodopirellula heiligendammensis]|uniref:Uncharacterized protein n=2 Tax=Allorhodopirellula heiligendammensis TaxID=2714739 RepID=A0A5C6C335_9BACT|nr:hypothetical protein Poly21_07020 [Allorhodopirellula heiligendammensis]
MVFVTAAMIAIRNIARDQYGGMQICMLVLPGAMLGIIELGRLIRDAETQGASLAIGPILMVTVVPLVGFVASLLVLMAAVLGVMLGWEWAMGRFNAWAERNMGQK